MLFFLFFSLIPAKKEKNKFSCIALQQLTNSFNLSNQNFDLSSTVRNKKITLVAIESGLGQTAFGICTS